MPGGNLASLVENYYTSLREESGTASRERRWSPECLAEREGC